MDRKSKREEEKLVKKLKKFCYENGKEKDLKEIGKLLHKIGSLYYDHNSGNQTTYVQSAILYNEALLRNPSLSNDINKDIQRLHSSALRRAGGNGKADDLNRLVTQLKKEVAKFRNQITLELSKIPVISNDVKGSNVRLLEEKKVLQVQAVQRSATASFVSIIYNVTESCLRMMGKPPCLFAVVCLGAIAREEVTPYSGYEVAVVLPKGLYHKPEFNKIENFFHWFLTLLHITFVNLGETPLKQGGIQSVDALTSFHNPCVFDSTQLGISFESLLSKPLILSPDLPIMEMLKLFEIPKKLSKVVHRHYLSDRLTKSSFVYGDFKTYDAYHSFICDFVRQKTADLSLSDYTKLVKASLAKVGFLRFLGYHQLEELRFDPRYVVHRGTQILVYALARLCGVKSSSCFDVVTELEEEGHISGRYAHQLRYLLAVACEVRLKLSVRNRRRVPSSLHPDMNDAEVQQMVGAVGRTSLVEYFWIAWSLYVDISDSMKNSEQLPLDLNTARFTKFGFLVYAKTCFHLRLYDACVGHCTVQLGRKASEKHWHAYRHILAAATERQGKCQTAMEHYQELVRVLEDESSDANRAEIAYMLGKMGRCALILNSPLDALTNLTRAQNIYDMVRSDSADPDTVRAACYDQSMECTLSLAECYVNGEKAEEVMALFKHHQFGYKELPVKNKRYNVRVRLIVGRCLVSMKNEELALSELHDALDLARKCVKDIGTDPLVAEATDTLGRCYLDFHRPMEAWRHLQANVGVEERVPVVYPYLRYVHTARWVSSVGACLHELKRYDEGLRHLQLAINLRRSGPKELRLAPYIALDLDHIASIQTKRGARVEALEALSQIRDMEGTIVRNDPCDFVTPKAIHDMGIILKMLDRWDEAKEHFEKERRLLCAMPKRPLPSNKPVGQCFFELMAKAKKRGADFGPGDFIDETSRQRKEEMFGGNALQLGSCAKQRGEFDEAIGLFKKALKYFRKSSVYLERQNVANVKHSIGGIGECLMKMSRFKEAIILFNKALELSRAIAENPGCDKEIFVLQEGVKLCAESIGEDYEYPLFTPLICHVLNN